MIAVSRRSSQTSVSSQSVAGPSRIRKRDKVANLTKKMFKKLPKVSLRPIDIFLIFPIANAGLFVWKCYWTFYEIDDFISFIDSMKKFDLMCKELLAVKSLWGVEAMCILWTSFCRLSFCRLSWTEIDFKAQMTNDKA